jgi:hypothetical protein
MQQPNKTTQPLGIACLFMSLAILPFSLRAVGIHPGFSLSAATDAFRQISCVIGTGYESSPYEIWAAAEPSCETTPLQQHSVCPSLVASREGECDGQGSQGVSAIVAPLPTSQTQTVVATCPRALHKAKVARVDSSRKMLELPVQTRVLADVLDLKANTIELPTIGSLSIHQRQSLVRAKRELREAAKAIEWTKEMTFVFKVRPSALPTIKCKATKPSSVKSINRTA